SHVAGGEGEPGDDVFDRAAFVQTHYPAGAGRGKAGSRRELEYEQAIVTVERQPGYRRQAQRFINDASPLGDVQDLRRARNDGESAEVADAEYSVEHHGGRHDVPLRCGTVDDLADIA